MPTVAELRAAFERECASTRHVLERVPASCTGFRPHPRSASLGELATHLSNIALWASFVLERERLDLEPPDGPRLDPPKFTSASDTLRSFDESVKKASTLLSKTTDPDLAREWVLLKAGVTIFRLPRGAAFRTMVLDHTIHHRGQLTVYLRLNEAPVPSIYGPTADEPAP